MNNNLNLTIDKITGKAIKHNHTQVTEAITSLSGSVDLKQDVIVNLSERIISNDYRTSVNADIDNDKIVKYYDVADYQPEDESVLHFNEATITKDEIVGTTWSTVGSVSRDTVNKKFGTSSISKNATSCMISPHSDKWNIFGDFTSNVTISIFFKTSVTNVKHSLVWHNTNTDANAWGLSFYGPSVGGSANYFQFVAITGGVYAVALSAPNLATGWCDGNWHHVAIVKLGRGTTYDVGIYYDGALLTSQLDRDINVILSAKNLIIGAEYNTGYAGLYGNIDEFLLTYSDFFDADNGVSFKSTITVPSSEYVGTQVKDYRLGTKHATEQTTAPTVNNDTTEGFSVGSTWADSTNKKVYTCFDSTSGIWKEISLDANAIHTNVADEFSNITSGTPTLSSRILWEDETDGYNKKSSTFNNLFTEQIVNITDTEVSAFPTFSGIKGQEGYYNNKYYRCISTNTWVRWAVETA